MFLEQMDTGEDLKDGDPALVLRRKLIRDGRRDGSKTPSEYKFAWFIKAWNFHRKDKRVKSINWKPGDDFPKAI